MLLKIRNLKVSVENKQVLNGVDLDMKKGETQALLGPNGSGKSVLAKALIGVPKYKITQGKILFLGKDVTKLDLEKRIKMGMSLSWQSPPTVKGVKFSRLLEEIACQTIDAQEIGISSLLNRQVNVGFSGGEKKISELAQIISLSPRFIIFDEIDSGLDIKKLEQVAKIIKKELINKNVSVLLITHYGEILKFLKPDWVQVMIEGKIISKIRDYKKALNTIKKYGYEKCRECVSGYDWK